MSAYTHNLTETLTYWSPGANDGTGRTAFGAPVSISGRWQARNVLFRDSQGREVVSEAVVYVSQALANGGYLYRGESAASEPPADAREVRAVQESPSLDGVDALHKALL